MNYTKPEIAVLGSASVVIESVDNKQSSIDDGLGGPAHSQPAYDLDE